MTNLPTQPVPPEIWYKTQRVLRSIFNALVTLIPLVNAGAFAVVDYLNRQQQANIPPWVFVWLNAIIVGTSLVMGVVARIMAIPRVNELLTKVGLGSVPKSALVPVVQPGTGQVVTAVAVDPHLDSSG